MSLKGLGGEREKGLSPPSAPEPALSTAQLEGPVPGAGGSQPGRKASPSRGGAEGLLASSLALEGGLALGPREGACRQCGSGQGALETCSLYPANQRTPSRQAPVSGAGLALWLSRHLWSVLQAESLKGTG